MCREYLFGQVDRSREHFPNVAGLDVVLAGVQQPCGRVIPRLVVLLLSMSWLGKIGDEVNLERCSDSALNDVYN